MTKERRNEIGYRLFQHNFSVEGRLIPFLPSGFESLSEATGIPASELKEFFRALVNDLVAEMFPQ